MRSQLYGIGAGLCVCLPTWVAMRYISEQVGLLVGLFLVTFFVVSILSTDSDERTEHHQTLAKAVTGMQVHVVAICKALEKRMEAWQETVTPMDSMVGRRAYAAEDLDKMIGMVEGILDDDASRPNLFGGSGQIRCETHPTTGSAPCACGNTTG